MLIGELDEPDPDITAEAIGAGIVEILRKPVRGSQLAAAIKRSQRLRAKRVGRDPQLTTVPDRAVVSSSEMRRAVLLAVRAAARRRGLLIIGEPGTGRE